MHGFPFKVVYRWHLDDAVVKIVSCPAAPEHVWQQNHCGVFYSADGCATWTKVSAPEQGVHFGFPIAVDERDGRTAWVVPALSDQQRMTIGGGLFVILFHVLVVTNIDNVLRPILVPKAARLDSALMLLSVFSGIAMFGFLGLVIGPVLMIVVVTTISVYLAVYKGVPLSEPEPDEPRAPGRLARLIAQMRQKQPAKAAAAPSASPPPESDSPPDSPTH